MIEIMRARRSIRAYEKKPIDAESLKTLKEALLRSPSSMGKNPWTFVFVDDPDILVHLSKAKEHGAEFIKGASLAIVVCGDESVSDVWVEDCSITSIVAHLTAHSLGLGSCWCQIRNRPRSGAETAEEYIQKLLGIPGNLRVEAVVAVGYPAEAKQPRPAEGLDYGKIHHNRYGKKAAL